MNRVALSERVKADALITSVPGVAIGVLTADCLPILLFDPVKMVVAAIHAGWRGTIMDIAKSTVERMATEYGSSAKDIISSIGPHIGPCCYTVGEDVAKEFIKKFGANNSIIEEDTVGSIEAESARLSLAEANILELEDVGVRKENIEDTAICTMCNKDSFFSYRGDDGTTGRQINFIMIRNT